MDQTVDFPLRIDLDSAAQSESAQAFIVAKVAEYRFHCGKAAAVLLSAFGTVDAFSHFGGVRVCLSDTQECDLPAAFRIGLVQAVRFERTVSAVLQPRAEFDGGVAADLAFAVAGE